MTKIAENGAQYSVLCQEDGGVIDDLFTYRFSEGGGGFLTVTNASNHERDLAWFQEHAEGFDGDVQVHDAHAEFAMLAVQGPDARATAARAARRRRARADALDARHGGGRARGGWSAAPATPARTGWSC